MTDKEGETEKQTNRKIGRQKDRNRQSRGQSNRMKAIEKRDVETERGYASKTSLTPVCITIVLPSPC